MIWSLLANNPLAELVDNRGCFSVSTPLAAGGTLRSIVYIDGDVTTKLIGTRELTANDIVAHFTTIDTCAARFGTCVRAIGVIVAAIWCALAAGLVIVFQDRQSIVGAVAVLGPVAILAVQQRLRRTFSIAAPLVATIAAAVAVAAAFRFDISDLIVPAATTLLCNLSLVVAFAGARARLRRMLGGRDATATVPPRPDSLH